jgi:hypothetical protein
MKKNPIFLAMLVVMLASSLVFIGCPDDDENKKKDKGKGLQWPADLTWDENILTGEKDGDWRTGSGLSGNSLSFSYNDGKAYLNIKKYGTTTGSTKEYFSLVKVDGKTLTVKGPETNNGWHNVDKGKEVVLCTDYTITGNKLTLTGSAIQVGDPLADLSGQEFTQVP